LTPAQQATAAVCQIAMLTCFIGLLRSGRWRLVYSFTAYVTLILTLGPLQTWLPERFNNWEYWSYKQTAYDVVKLAFAVEIAAIACRHFPGARAATSKWLLAIFLLTALGLAWHPWTDDPILTLASEIRARAAIGTVWLLAATAVMINHYRLPVHPFVMALLVGMGAYLAVSGALLRLLQMRGWAAYDLWARVDPLAYAVLAAWLAWVAWRKDGAATEDYEAVVSMARERATA
jgi:hypothetical protein